MRPEAFENPGRRGFRAAGVLTAGPRRSGHGLLARRPVTGAGRARSIGAGVAVGLARDGVGPGAVLLAAR